MAKKTRFIVKSEMKGNEVRSDLSVAQTDPESGRESTVSMGLLLHQPAEAKAFLHLLNIGAQYSGGVYEVKFEGWTS